jgi:hypothetical protein
MTDQNETEKKPPAPLSREERNNQRLMDRLEQIHRMRGYDAPEVVGYVYRDNWDATKSALPPVNAILLDHEFGALYGPGRYSVSYFKREEMEDGNLSGLQKFGTVTYNISAEFSAVHVEFCQQNGRTPQLDSRAMIPGMQQQQAGGLADLLTPEKMKAAAGFLAALKEITGSGGNNQNQLFQLTTELIRANGRNPQQVSGVGDSVVSEALKMIAAPRHQSDPMKALRDSVETLRDLQTLTNPAAAAAAAAAEEERNEGKMTYTEKMISQALDALPSLLQAFGGNVKAAAQQAKADNPLQTAIIKGSAKLQREFYTQCAARYGRAHADQWALGLGLDPSSLGAIEVQPIQHSNAPQAAGMVF